MPSMNGKLAFWLLPNQALVADVINIFIPNHAVQCGVILPPYKITFGTSGWRERMDSGFNMENVSRIAYGIGAYLRYAAAHGTLIAGYDTREHSKEFAEVACAVLSSMEFNTVITNACVPLPALSFAVKDMKAAGGIMITASHNPAVYNGLKFIDAGGMNPTKEITDRIVELIPENGVAIQKWQPKIVDIKGEYLNAIGRRFDLENVRGMRVVVDTFHGAGSGYLADLLRRYGAEVIELRSSYRSDFGGTAPVPDKANLGELIEAVKKTKADIGIANDGDADRFAVVGADGRYYTANESGLMMCDYLFGYRHENGAVAKSIQSTSAIDRLCHRYGVESKEVAVGFKNIAVELANGAAFGIEGAAQGVAFGNWILDKDGIAAGALACEMIAVEKMSLAEIWKIVSREFEYGSFVNISIEKTPEIADASKRFAAIKAGQEFSSKTVESVSYLDGVKLSLDGGAWVLFRESGTEPLVRIYAEAKSKGETDALIESAKRLIGA